MWPYVNLSAFLSNQGRTDAEGAKASETKKRSFTVWSEITASAAAARRGEEEEERRELERGELDMRGEKLG